MTEEEKLSAASEYFSNHPQSDAWKNADDPLRRGALRIAELDVAIAFGFGDLPDAPEINFAIFEQALHLLESAGQSPGETILSESLEGIGSRTIQPRQAPLLSTRAEQILKPFLTITSARISRG